MPRRRLEGSLGPGGCDQRPREGTAATPNGAANPNTVVACSRAREREAASAAKSMVDTNLLGAFLVSREAAKLMRKDRPFVFTNMKTGEGVETITRFIETKGGLSGRA